MPRSFQARGGGWLAAALALGLWGCGEPRERWYQAALDGGDGSPDAPSDARTNGNDATDHDARADAMPRDGGDSGGDGGLPDGMPGDGGVGGDGGLPDAMEPDAMPPDAMPPDAMPPDAAPPDAMAMLPDGGTVPGVDARPGAPDAGVVDAPPVDGPDGPPASSYYACATGGGDPAAMIPIALAALAGRRRRRTAA
ncbi:MAG: MYXO-CTERM sorting domain-containing protein [Kofleriaceae bacterium]